MTLIQVMPDGRPETVLLRSQDTDEITATLRPHGVEFFRWDLPSDLDPDADQDTVLGHFDDKIADLTTEGGYRLVDLARMRQADDDPDWPAKAAKARSMFLEEHRHDEDEVRFFVAGRGCFYLHIAGNVTAVVCEGGDLMSVPAGTTHWFDMGKSPDFAAIRFFQKEDGWVGDFTGNPISSAFPTLDALLVAH